MFKAPHLSVWLFLMILFGIRNVFGFNKLNTMKPFHLLRSQELQTIMKMSVKDYSKVRHTKNIILQDTKPRWYGIIVREKKEKVAKDFLDKCRIMDPRYKDLHSVKISMRKAVANKGDSLYYKDVINGPGHLYVNMTMGPEIYEIMNYNPFVVCFVGKEHRDLKSNRFTPVLHRRGFISPMPFTDIEVKALLDNEEKQKLKIYPTDFKYKINDLVEITSIPYNGSRGLIHSFSNDRVMISFYSQKYRRKQLFHESEIRLLSEDEIIERKKYDKTMKTSQEILEEKRQFLALEKGLSYPIKTYNEEEEEIKREIRRNEYQGPKLLYRNERQRQEKLSFEEFQNNGLKHSLKGLSTVINKPINNNATKIKHEEYQKNSPGEVNEMFRKVFGVKDKIRKKPSKIQYVC